jgi:hypothetical protein
VSLPIFKVEAYLEPTKERLGRKMIAPTVKLISLPTSKPARKALTHALNVGLYKSPLSEVYIAVKTRLKPRVSGPPIGNPPWIQPPSIDHSYRIKIKERSQAIEEAAITSGANILDLYTDASVAKRLASIAVVRRTGIATQVVRQDSIGWASTCGVLSAEIAAMAAALKYAQEHLQPLSQLATLALVMFSDCHQVL